MKYFVEHALVDGQWREKVEITVDRQGTIGEIRTDSRPSAAASRLKGLLVPGISNLHSHAHQRLMAGLAEHRRGDNDSFWTWRDTMYGFLLRITPEQLQAIAAMLYLEMLLAGYTSVGEFHYLHHQPDGRPYSRISEMAQRLFAAAEDTGISLTLLPALYRFGDFGGQAAGDQQRRFICDTDSFLTLVDECRQLARKIPGAGLGIAHHSLRAVSPEMLDEVTAAARSMTPAMPIHLHIAEQQLEVEACVRWSGGLRPVEWLFANQPVDQQWCLIHATHLSSRELELLGQSSAVVGLCPTTEANLGDGIFPAADFMRANGRFGIGSDSQIIVDPAEELRLLEYGQRLHHHRRNCLVGPESDSTGRTLYQRACAGGGQALANRSGVIKSGCRADFVCLDSSHRNMVYRDGDRQLDSWVFTGQYGLVTDVVVSGQQVIKDRRHSDQERIEQHYHHAIKQLLN